MITTETVVLVNSDYVEFRTPTNFGAQVVKVWTTASIPRIMAYSEWIVDDERRQNPMSLFIDEVIEYCEKAFALANRELKPVQTVADLKLYTL